MGNSVKGTKIIVQSGEHNESKATHETRQDISVNNETETDTETDIERQSQRPNSNNINNQQYTTLDEIETTRTIPSDTGYVKRNSSEIIDSSDKPGLDNRDVSDSQIQHRSNLKSQQKQLIVRKASFQKVRKKNTADNETKSLKPSTAVSQTSIHKAPKDNDVEVSKTKLIENEVTENDMPLNGRIGASALGKERNNHQNLARQEKVHMADRTTSALKSKLNRIGETQNASPSFSDTRSTYHLNKKASTLIKTRVHSEPVRPTHITSSLALGTLQEKQMEDRADSVMTKYSDQLIETESIESAIDDEEKEFDISSSLRSTALDSRLFDSQSSIVTHTSAVQHKPVSRYSENRWKLKNGLLEYYMSYSLSPAEFPLLPRTDKPKDAPHYLPPWMTVKRHISTESDIELADDFDSLDTIDMNNYEIEKNINQFHHLFNHEGQKIKTVYIVGDTGTGKTAFCRHLIQQWCVQHAQRTGITNLKEPVFSRLEDAPASSEHSLMSDTTPDGNSEQPGSTSNKTLGSKPYKVFNDSDELDKYEFLFYIPLFFETNHDNIHDLIKTQFKNIFARMSVDENVEQTKPDRRKGATFLDELLDKESEKCLIVLDGLDAWRPKKKRSKELSNDLLETDPSKAYTIIVTSTSEILEEIGMKAKISDLEVMLNGIEECTSNELINNVVDRLNNVYRRKKKSEDMITEMKKWKETNYQRLPFIVQALVYLWYHSGEIGNTICDIFSRILELQFKIFNDDITTVGDTGRKTNVAIHDRVADKDVHLPRYYIDLSNCQKNKELIFVLGQIAWSTRVQTIKSFDSATLEVSGFSPGEISSLIKVGILTQNKVPGFSEVLHNKTVFFSDENFQNFLATSYIAVLCRNIAYENMGHIDLHTRNIRSVVDAHFDCFSSLENIFQFSNMIVLLCGLYPATIEQLTQKINDTVSADKRILKFRNNVEIESEEDVCEDVQNMIFRCAHESLSVNTDNFLIHVGDIFYGNIDCDHLTYVLASDVKSLSINVDDTSVIFPDASKFIHQTRIFSRLQKLMVRDETSRLTLQDIESIHALTERCISTLKVISYVFNIETRITYLRITQDLDRLLPKMTNLSELELKGMKLGHNKFGSLASVLSQMSCLKRLQLSDITCEMQRCDGEEHKMDFSQYENLEYIDIDGRELPVVSVNKSKLITCILGNLPQGPELRTFSSLRKAKCLKHFTQTVRQRPPFISQTLIQTLNTWHGLETVNLNGVNFGENELIVSKQLKNISCIRLIETRMSRTGWCHFVDCLPGLTQEIIVVSRDIHIMPVIGDVTRDPLRRPIDSETRALMFERFTGRQEAFDYVREKLNVFRVLFDLENMFDFVKEASGTLIP